ncbi:glycosyltransferase family 4 protein [Psychroserpens sp.]|uniref:glycosyltransferase family 4 protein n=1 Tax=Psychroserpens sp. TaxID=2020870 RepID=UPI003C772056
MKKILYVGNNLQIKGANTSYIAVLGGLLGAEGYDINYTSKIKNKYLRLFDMISSVIAKSQRVDLVLIDTYSTQNFYYAYIISQICRLFHLQYVPILHGGNLPYRLKAHPKLCSQLFKHSKTNVAPSMYLKTVFERYGYQNVVHIPNTIQIKHYRFSNNTYDTPRLLWVRSFAEIYNPKLAIRVYKSLNQIYPNARLCMVGPDSDGTLQEVKQLARTLNLKVNFTGKLSKSQWIELSREYNIFINTTNFDNTPVSVIEAMALGLPVISTNVGGMPYLIKHNHSGILVTPNNADAMVAAIDHIMKNTELRSSIIGNARQQVEQFDWIHIKQQWIATLER